ncbi:MAG: hypothetical protein PHV06_09220 [bacterium]|nr:hypothetical protein [bacterium]
MNLKRRDKDVLYLIIQGLVWDSEILFNASHEAFKRLNEDEKSIIKDIILNYLKNGSNDQILLAGKFYQKLKDKEMIFFDILIKERIKEYLREIILNRSQELSEFAQMLLLEMGFSQDEIDMILDEKNRRYEDNMEKSIEHEKKKKGKEERVRLFRKIFKYFFITIFILVILSITLFVWLHFPVGTSIFLVIVGIIYFAITLILYRCPKCKRFYGAKLQKKTYYSTEKNTSYLRDERGNTVLSESRRIVYRYNYKCKYCGHHWQDIR